MKIYQSIFENSPDGVFVIDQTGQITLANAQAETLFGYARSELIGQSIDRLVPARYAKSHADHCSHYMTQPHIRLMGTNSELYARRKQGDEFPADVMLSPMTIDGVLFVVCVVRDVTERKIAQDKLARQTEELRKLHEELKQVASHDGLTGLYNWRAFYEHAEQMLKSAHRRRENVALMMLDLDHFKQVNDRFGHAEGDRVLQAVASTLKATARENDIVARHGGEEFVVATLGLSEAESLVAAERLRAAIAAIENMKCPITISIGVTLLTPRTQKQEASQTLTELLDQADQALYAAKNTGRNRVCHYNHIDQCPERTSSGGMA